MGKGAYELLKTRILSGEYASGEIINEKALAAELEVSRTPIRESLARLEWEKLVTIIPRAGAMVAPAELTPVKEAYQVRYVLEGYLGRLAAARANADHIQELQTIKADCEKLVDQGSQQDLNNISLRMRKVLGDAAGNKTLTEISDMLFNITIRVWRSVSDNDVHSELARALIAEIDAIIAAFLSKDEAAAETAMQEAMTYYTEKLKRIF